MVAHNFRDLTGMKFGKLTVICRADDYVQPNGNKSTQWLCSCECGKNKIVKAAYLVSSHTVSCGCYAKDLLKKRSIKHGKRQTRIYRTWCGIKRRCYNKNDKAYKHYGERGVTICEQWKDDFSSFYNWATKNGYTDELSIDRIDNNGNYCPENCRWVTAKEQNRNYSRNHNITFNGITMCITDWDKKIGRYKGYIYTLIKSGLSDKEALEKGLSING